MSKKTTGTNYPDPLESPEARPVSGPQPVSRSVPFSSPTLPVYSAPPATSIAPAKETVVEPELLLAKSPDSSSPPTSRLSREDPSTLKQLQALLGNSLTVSQFASACSLGESARTYLDYLISRDLVVRSWEISSGRYSLTEAGRDKLNAATTGKN